MINNEDIYNVKNRSTSVVVYTIPDTNLRREFAPGETKRIPFGELEVNLSGRRSRINC